MEFSICINCVINYRLLVIEKISKYREEKLKREFIKIEQELRIED